MPADGRDQRRCEPVGGEVTAQVHEMHGRRLRRAGALRQPQSTVAFRRDVGEALEGGRRRAEHDRHAELARAPHGDVAGGVAKPVLLLEGAIVFLVDDDQPGARQRREHRRARADDDPGAPVPRPDPGVQALPVGEPRMQERDLRGRKAPAEALHELRREADLRHQHQALAAVWRAASRCSAGKPRSCRCRSRPATGRPGTRALLRSLRRLRPAAA